MITGHPWAADLLFLIAAVLFGCGFAVQVAGRAAIDAIVLYAGLCAVAVGWLVL